MHMSEDELQELLQRMGKKKKPAKAPAASPSGQERLQALGRMKSGEMNKTEAAFAQRLELQRHAGEVLWWKFEGIKLMLAKNTSITVDFAVMLADCRLFMIDVKGSKAIFTDDARAKMKVAAELYPFAFQAAYPKPKSEGSGWVFEDF